VAAGCLEDPGLVGAPKMTLLVTVEEAGISATPTVPTRARHDHTAPAALLVELRDRAGGLVYSERVPDPRTERREWFDGRSGQSEIVSRSLATFTITVPGAEGELVVFADGGAGPAIGSAAVAPLTRAAAALVSSQDVGALQQLGPRSGHADAVDVLFIPEGYTSGQLSDFDAVVDDRIREIQSRPDWGQYNDTFNFWAYEVASRDSGVDTEQRQVDSAFDYSVGPPQGQSRMRRPQTTDAGYRLVKQLGAQAGAEVTVVVINSPNIRSNGGNGVVNLAPDDRRPGVISHELGHAVLGLADEYSDGRGAQCYWGDAPNVSMSADLSRLRWSDLVESNTPLPTPTRVDEIGAYSGAATCDQAYRPTLDCMMRSNAAEVCPVCEREMQRYFGVSERSHPRDEGAGDEGGGDGEGSGQWTCDPGYRGSGDGCDCGCGETDPDCAGDGCTAPGCAASGCRFCYDAGGATVPCAAPRNEHHDPDDAVPDSWQCDVDYYGRGDGCDCGCGAQDPDCGSSGCSQSGCFQADCQHCHEGGAPIGCGSDDGAPDSDDCSAYDWDDYCVDDDDYCDEADPCCEWDSDEHDGGPCRNLGGADGGECDDYDWDEYCVDDDDYCDEGDGCCGYDWDDHDGGPCD